MKSFLTLSILSVCVQGFRGTIKTQNGPFGLDGDECFAAQGTAIGVSMPKGTVIYLYDGYGCRNGRYTRAWGDVNFSNPVNFKSVKMSNEDTGRSFYNGQSESGYESGDSAPPSYYYGPSFYNPNYYCNGNEYGYC